MTKNWVYPCPVGIHGLTWGEDDTYDLLLEVFGHEEVPVCVGRWLTLLVWMVKEIDLQSFFSCERCYKVDTSL
jgi:hypothetical protein